MKEKTTSERKNEKKRLQTLYSTKPLMHDTDPPPHNQPSPKDLFQAGHSVSGLSRDGWTACFDASGLSRRPSCGA